jgi:hypothetical protein
MSSNWPHWPHSVDFSYTIQSNSSVIFLFSRGSYGFGEVTYELSNKTSSGDKIEIDIKMSYYTPLMVARTRVCLLARDGGRGIGFFVSNVLVRSLISRISKTLSIRLLVGYLETRTKIITSDSPRLFAFPGWTRVANPSL